MKSAQKKLHSTTRILVGMAGAVLFIALFVPIWQIQLTAPQYPEGLELFIHADKLSGDVKIINGLNHYIGMKELHKDDFIEFVVLPYIIVFLGVIGLLTAVVNRRELFFFWVIFFAVFGILTIIRFYLWLYDYGHNLDPKAPIQVPGMSYQPPMIGYKKLLNFGAYSIPVTGGWIMIGAVVMAIWGVLVETKFKKKKV
ncbi:MAG: hypothetical protein AB7D46_03130 [Flavobacteriaceae bacterium]